MVQARGVINKGKGQRPHSAALLLPSCYFSSSSLSLSLSCLHLDLHAQHHREGWVIKSRRPPSFSIADVTSPPIRTHFPFLVNLV